MGVISGIFLGVLRAITGVLLVALRFAIPILAGVGLVALFRRRRAAPKEGPRKKPDREPDFQGPVYTVDYQEVPAEPALSAEPDGPTPFGYKTAWLAVRCGDPKQVIEALRPKAREPANWTTGLAAAHADRGRLFVSPCLDGFVLVAGLESARLPDGFPGDFIEVQYFASHRVADYYHWRLWRSGISVREYCWDGGEVEADARELTPEELALGFGAFPRQGVEWAEDQRFPDEESVLDIAAAWGVDPRFEPGRYPPSTGWVCTIS